MCVICVLPKGITIPFNKLENAVFNNPHGYGIVLKDNGLLEVKKKFYPEGTDPEEVARILTDNKDVERILHVRWKTEGGLGLENTQPFPVYYSQGKKIVQREFMHNGTLYEYKSGTGRVFNQGYGYAAEEEDLDLPSDSRNFADKILSQLLLNYNGPEGKADISDPFFQQVVNKFWGTGTNRGIIIANDQDNFIINRNSWSTIKTDEGEFLSSNDQYFDKLERGYEYEKREKAKREAERAAREAEEAKKKASGVVVPIRSGQNDWPMSKLSEVSFNKRKAFTKDLNDLFEDMNLYGEDDGYASLASLTVDEIRDFAYADAENLAAFVVMLTSTLETYYKEKTELAKDKEKATKYIATLKHQIAQAAANDVDEQPKRVAATRESKIG